MVKKETKQDLLLGELKDLNNNFKRNYALLEMISKTLKMKTLDVDSKRSIESVIFTTLFGICAALVVYGISIKYDFNSFIASGLLGTVIVFFVMLVYYMNN